LNWILFVMMNVQPDDKEKPENGYSVPASRNVSVWLDTYDDIFSDFDPRPLAERNISDDFLYETKKFYHEKESNITQFILLIPEKMRDKEKETVIIKRLNHYFRKSHQNLLLNTKRENRKNWFFTLSGISLTFLAGYISLNETGELFMHTLFVIFEPAGWFLMWIGLESLLRYKKKEKPELNFYSKMIRSKISFRGF